MASLPIEVACSLSTVSNKEEYITNNITNLWGLYRLPMANKRRLYRLPVKVHGCANTTSLIELSIVQPNLREGVSADQPLARGVSTDYLPIKGLSKCKEVQMLLALWGQT